MAMIALGGAIGTGESGVVHQASRSQRRSGLFVGSGSALATGGPVGVWLGYIFMSSMVYAVMVALGEMASLFPVAGGFTHYAARFVDPALGFATGELSLRRLQSELMTRGQLLVFICYCEFP